MQYVLWLGLGLFFSGIGLVFAASCYVMSKDTPKRRTEVTSADRGIFTHYDDPRYHHD